MSFNFQFSILDFLKRHWLTVVIALALSVGALWGFSAWNLPARCASPRRLGPCIRDLESEMAGGGGEKSAGAASSWEQKAHRKSRSQKSEVRQLTAKLEKAQAEAAAEKARIAALPPEEVGPELQKTVPTAGILRFAQDDKEGARRVLEIIADRDACLQLSTLDSQLLLTAANPRGLRRHRRTAGQTDPDLKQALDLEKRAFDKRDDLAKVQAKTAKGTWIHRAGQGEVSGGHRLGWGGRIRGRQGDEVTEGSAWAYWKNF